MNAHQYMSSDEHRPLAEGTGSVEGSETHGSLEERLEGMSLPPIVVATILREVGITGVQSYFTRLRQYLDVLSFLAGTAAVDGAALEAADSVSSSRS